MESINALSLVRDKLKETDIQKLTPAQAAQMAEHLAYLLSFASQDDAEVIWESSVEPKRNAILEQDLPF
jgi:D-hexose-6-phosphate mutarotase